MLDVCRRLAVDEGHWSPQPALHAERVRLREHGFQALRKMLFIDDIFSVDLLPPVVHGEQRKSIGAGFGDQGFHQRSIDVAMPRLPRVVNPFWRHLLVIVRDAIANVRRNSPMRILGCSALIQQNGAAAEVKVS